MRLRELTQIILKKNKYSKETDVQINEELLSKAVEQTIQPYLIEKGALFDPKLEGYHHQKVIPKVQQIFQREKLEQNPKEVITAMIDASFNLLSQFEKVSAKDFIDRCNEEELKKKCLDLFFSNDLIQERLKRFYQWSKYKVVGQKKIGFNSTSVSFLISSCKPKEFAFCKPSIFKPAVKALTNQDEARKDNVERIAQCTEFYSEVLKLFQNKHHLPFEDLFHVHIAFYVIQQDNGLPNWEQLNSDKIITQQTSPGFTTTVHEQEIFLTDEIGQLILKRKNVILYGSIGTGKTHSTLRIADIWRRNFGEDSIDQVTFHPSYAYEDFIEGYRPTDQGQFELRDGLFLKACEKARLNPDRKFLFIIDEINRGDVSRLFGELITLIEMDKRYEGVARKLPYSQRTFWVPDNLYLLGTMNTADKSISLMDVAIRRRFAFVGIYPDAEVFADSSKHCSEIAGIELGELLSAINQRLLDNGFDKDKTIGHSFFLVDKEDSTPLDTLRERMRYDVLPLIEEFCFAERSLIQKILGNLVDQNGNLDENLFEDDDLQFIEALKELIANK
jgi:catechol 2,3-dioxygenase-like lactoylglutathione lyase family enzyme